MNELAAKYQDYMRRVEVGLSALPAADRDELVRELASHLADAQEAGTSAGDLAARMGEPEAVAAGLLAERMALLDRRLGQADVARLALASVLGPFALVASCVLAGLAAIAILGRLGPVDARGFAVFAAWVALAFAGFSGWPVLARRVAPERLARSTTVAWMGVFGLALASAMTWIMLGTHAVFPTTVSEAWGQVQQQHAANARLAPEPVWPAPARQHSDAGFRDFLMHQRISRAQHDDALRAIAMAEAEYGEQLLTGSSTFGVAVLGLAFGYLRARRIARGPLWAAILSSCWILLAAFFLGLVGIVLATASPIGAGAAPVITIGLLGIEAGLLALVGAWSASLLRREATHG